MGAIRAFGMFEFDTAASTLRRAGTPVRLGQRAATILDALTAAGGRVVSKPELMDKVWPGLFVEEANLSVQVSHLRRTLGTRADGAEWIVTVPGLGYRFAVEDGVSTPRDHRPDLVILPFDQLDGDTEGHVISEGLVAELIAALSRFHAFTTISRSIAFTYRSRTVPSREVAAELGVAYVLEGTVRRHGERLRVTAQLVDGTTGRQIWAERYERTLGDVFEVQDAIVEAVAIRVGTSLQAHEVALSRRNRPASAASYDIYLQALADLTDESEQANRRAFWRLEQALVSDPDNATILAQAAWALEHRHTMGWPPIGDDDVDLCLRLARRGLQHAAGDAVVMAQCGMALLQAGRDYAGGLAVLRAACAANPMSLFVNAAAGVAEIHCGDLEQAEARLQRIVTLSWLDPDIRFALCGLAMIHIIRAEYELALARAGHALAVNPQFDATYWMLVAANAHLGRLDESRRQLAKLRRLAPSVTLSSIRRGQPAMIPGRIDPVLAGLRLAGLGD
jgi:TolB-like protein